MEKTYSYGEKHNQRLEFSMPQTVSKKVHLKKHYTASSVKAPRMLTLLALCLNGKVGKNIAICN